MPAKKKATRKKTTAKKKTARRPKKVYHCVPCGTEITVSREGMGVTRFLCCGKVMKPKMARKRVC